jgi:hypothetical protein
MKVRITRPVVITGDGGLRSLAPGLIVEAEGEVLDQIVRQQGGGPPEQPKSRKPRRARA